jgi:hypothetical protein
LASNKHKVPYGIRFARSQYSFIVSKEKERKKAYHKIKESLSFPDLCESVDFLEKSLNPRWRKLLWGNPLPESYEELGNLSEIPYLGENVLAELNFCLVSIRKFKHEINLFLNYKEQYETFLLTGEYSRAEDMLDRIENDICHSLWSLENRFLLKEVSGKAPENKELLSHFNETNPSGSIIKSLAHYLSLRAENSLSVNRYFNDLEMALNEIPEGQAKEAFQNYYRFRLTYLSHIDFTDYAGILSLDFENSIIDRYLHLVRVLTNLLVVSNYLDDDSSIDRRELLKSYLLNRINYLIRKINDPVLFKLKLLGGDQIFPAFDSKKSEAEVRIIDSYTSGLYSKVEEEIKDILLTKPSQFDLYVLYIKALVYQKKPFTPIGTKGSVQNQILRDLHKIISVDGNPDQAGHNLLRIANNLTSCVLSYGITDFVFYQTKGKDERRMISRIAYNFSNPIIHEVFPDAEDKVRFLDLLESKFPDSITVQFFKGKYEGLENLLKFEQKIPEGKFKVEYARKLQEKGDYLGAISEWQFLVDHYKDTTPILETAIINLFYCLQKLERIDDCINLYVNSFFFNNYIIDKIETDELLELIHSSKFKNVSKTIELPIFYTIVDADEVEAHIAFELFNIANGVEKPSDLLKTKDKFDTEKFDFYIEFCCRSKILMHSPFINSSKERLEERLELANYINSVSTEENKPIQDEIKSIENILIIQQGSIDLDESKIYVNEEGIINSELQEFEAIYERFEIISGITDDKKTFYFVEGGKLTTFSSKENTEYEKIAYSNNPVFEIYSELFEAVKDKFLNSQFGIVAYLSTRIRHGVLIGELRPIFEFHKLITFKEGTSSNYRRNYYWDEVYKNYGGDSLQQLQLLLSDFSSKVDGLIFDMIKKYLQVYKEGINDDGWFNYDFDDTDLWLYAFDAIRSENFEDFVNRVFKILWSRTDENLDLIRSKIENEILEEFNEYFNDLEVKLNEQFGANNCQQLIKEIKDCSTEIQTVMQKISRWFKRSKIVAADFELSELVTLISENINRSNLYKRLDIEVDLQWNLLFKGEFKTHLADLLRIFLENIIKHSAEGTHRIKCKISSEQLTDDILQISVDNEITNLESIKALKAVWSDKKMDVSKLVSEGKSGYHKAYKILTSDLKSSNDRCLSTIVSEDEKWFQVSVCLDTKELTP